MNSIQKIREKLRPLGRGWIAQVAKPPLVEEL